MDRRHLLRSGLGAAAVVGGSHGVFSSSAGAKVPAESLDRRAVGAWSKAYGAVQPDYAPVTINFDRPLPAGLQGTLFRNGPALMRRGDTAFRHWFDGDALVHSYRIGNNTLTHRASMVRTERFVAEQAAGRYLWDGFGTSLAGARPLIKPDDVNVANISVLPVQGELLALWEAGSPYRLDPTTLATRGRKTWSKDSDRLPFSAHPRVDRDGTIWSFGYLSGTGKIVLYRLDASGAQRAMSVIDAPNADMIHDFAITERFLVFSLMPLIAAPRDQFASALERYRWQPQQASVVLLIDKSTLTIAHRIEMPALMNFHLGNAWDDGQSVRFHSMRVGDYHGLMNAMYSAVAGAAVKPFASKDDGIVELVVDLPRAKVAITTLAPGGLDFPAWDRRRSGQRTDQLLALRASASVPKDTFAINELVLIDQARGRRSSWDYGEHAIAEEHLFAPHATASATAAAPGWIIGTHYNWMTQRTTLSVLDANHVADGPICSAQLPYGFPPGLHGAFVAG